MTLTSPNCPMAEIIPNGSRVCLRAVECINRVKVTLTFDPALESQTQISDEGKYPNRCIMSIKKEFKIAEPESLPPSPDTVIKTDKGDEFSVGEIQHPKKNIKECYTQRRFKLVCKMD